MTRYVFITGGVSSSLGKGLSTAALGALLQARGFTVRLRKLDPYLNIDPGTMSPYQHGEVFVTDDGAETDLDLGHYERFTGVSARRSDNVTAGKVYSDVLARERRGDYLGGTVQVIPHVTDAIKAFITAEVADEDFIICEIGGTVGDIEGLPFFEAIRQLGNEVGREKSMFIHVTLVPYLQAAGEIKTKPTQHSVKELLSVGIQPDLLLCRSEHPIMENERKKLALFCNVREERVVPALDVASIYQVPVSYHAEGFDVEVLKHFGLLEENGHAVDLSLWNSIAEIIEKPEDKVDIAVIGKYTTLIDAYKSLFEALTHGGIANKVKVAVRWVDSERFENEEYVHDIEGCHGILIPGGFGERGAEGKIRAVSYARTRKIPYFGICFGMQMAVIEAARSLASVTEAGTTEFGPCSEPVVGLLTEWLQGEELTRRDEKSNLGGTMRLGSYPCLLEQGSQIAGIYGGAEKIEERHRHRYEVNLDYKEKLEASGIKFSGMSPDGRLPEIIEFPDHPWFIGVQFHPELKSKPFAPHPLFAGFIQATLEQSRLV